MPEYLVDANLPYYFSLWNSQEYIHIKNIGEEWPDEKIWNYALENNMTIITKDSDFSKRILLKDPPPKIIHIKVGNMKLRDLYIILTKMWSEVLLFNKKYKLVNVFDNGIEGIN